jgi:hypothetical protein
MRLIIEPDKDAVGLWAANYVKQRINEFAPTAERQFVIGLPTGSSPLETYKHLVTMYKAGEVSFKHVVSFNMDEVKRIGGTPARARERRIRPAVASPARARALSSRAAGLTATACALRVAPSLPARWPRVRQPAARASGVVPLVHEQKPLFAHRHPA